MLLELKNICKSYGDHIVFDHLNVDFSSPGFYLLSGKSGSGKTTLLNIIAGYEDFNSGKRIAEGASISCIFQSYELIPELTVLENVRMGADLHGKNFDESLFLKLGLKEVANHYPNELSGGQKQRVGIARAFYQNPNVIICDEPTESLDIDNKELILKLLKELSKDKVVIVASHEISFAEKYLDYHYEIQDCQLVCQAKGNEQRLNDTSKADIKYQRSNLNHYIHQIIQRRTMMAAICFSILLIFQIALYIFDMSMFTPKTSLKALNSHVIYVDLYNEDRNILNGIDIVIKPIVSFEPLEINSKRYRINVYPLENEDYVLSDNEVIINDQLLSLYENEDEKSILGKQIVLHCEIMNESVEIPVVIKEVVKEEDSYYPQMYYNYDGVMEVIKNYFNIFLYENEYESFLENINKYEVIADNSTIEKLYDAWSYNTNITVSHSILDMRKQNQNQMSLYHILFLTIELIAMEANIVAIVYFNKKDSDKNKTALALIYNLQIPMNVIKWEYFKQKTLYMLIPGMIISCALMIIESVYAYSLRIPIGYTILIILIYILSLSYQVICFRRRDISLILKDNKD